MFQLTSIVVGVLAITGSATLIILHMFHAVRMPCWQLWVLLLFIVVVLFLFVYSVYNIGKSYRSSKFVFQYYSKSRSDLDVSPPYMAALKAKFSNVVAISQYTYSLQTGFNLYHAGFVCDVEVGASEIRIYVRPKWYIGLFSWHGKASLAHEIYNTLNAASRF